MQIKDVTTDKDGLVKLVNFMGSEGNVFKIEDCEEPSEQVVFFLERVATQIPHARSITRSNTSSLADEITYSVSIGQNFLPDNLKYQNAILDLVKEVYK